MFFYDWLYIVAGIVLIPGLIFGVVAQTKVKTNYSKYSKVFAKKDIPANVMARKILDASGLQEIKVIKVKGELTDHFNQKEKVLALSEEVYDSSSISALGIAAHELGHALQYKDKDGTMKLRNFFGGVSRLGSILLIPLIIIGLIIGVSTYANVSVIVVLVGIAFYGFSIIFNLVTLPLEYNASKRAQKILIETGLLDEEEIDGVKKVLKAAALTYVASLVVSILYLLRFLFYIFLRSKKD